MTIDEEIIQEGMQKIQNDPVMRANMLSNLGDIKEIGDYRKRKQIAAEIQQHKSENQQAINQMEIEACENLLGNQHFQWWMTRVLLPLTEMPKDEDTVTITEATRRKQIEALTYDKLLNRILEKGRKQVT